MRGALAVGFVLLASIAQAQSFPARPVTIYLGFPPGSSTDVITRLVAGKLTTLWGQPVIAENRVGAGGSIASAATVRAKPDGHTLLVNSNSHTINPSIIASLPYDTLKDFTDIAPITVQPNVLVVSSQSPYKTLADYTRTAKADPNKVTLAHAGPGSGTHLHAERFVQAAGIQTNMIPFRGTPDILTAILGGNVDSYWLPLSAGLAQIRAGKLRGLAIGSEKRHAQIPEVPTTTEGGVSNGDISLWFGLWGPAGIPSALVERINVDVQKVLADPDTREKLAAIASEPMSMSPAVFSRFVRSEIDQNRALLQRAGIKPQ